MPACDVCIIVWEPASWFQHADLSKPAAAFRFWLEKHSIGVYYY